MDIKVNGKPKFLPTSWNEIKFGLYLKLCKPMTRSEAIGVLLDEPGNIKIQGYEKIYAAVSFLDKAPVVEEHPVKIGDFVFPLDIGFESKEQFEDTVTEIQRSAATGDLVEQTKSLALYAAIYCVGKDDYTLQKAHELAEKFMDYPCLEVMAAGSFFQAKSLSAQSGLSMSYLRRNTLLRKSRPVLNRLLKRLGFTLHLTRSRGTSELAINKP